MLASSTTKRVVTVTPSIHTHISLERLFFRPYRFDYHALFPVHSNNDEANVSISSTRRSESIHSGQRKAVAYVLLTTRNGDSEQAAAIIRRQPGVVMADQIEGAADVIFAVKASSRERLAILTLQAIATVEGVVDDVQLLPAK